MMNKLHKKRKEKGKYYFHIKIMNLKMYKVTIFNKIVVKRQVDNIKKQ